MGVWPLTYEDIYRWPDGLVVVVSLASPQVISSTPLQGSPSLPSLQILVGSVQFGKNLLRKGASPSYRATMCVVVATPSFQSLVTLPRNIGSVWERDFMDFRRKLTARNCAVLQHKM